MIAKRGLLRAEILRIRSKRSLGLLFVGCIGLITVTVVLAASVSHRPTEGELGAARVTESMKVSGCVSAGGTQNPLPPGVTPLEDCEREFGDFAAYLPDHLRYSTLPDLVVSLSPAAVVVGLLFGSLTLGSPFQSGFLAMMLTWEPRRSRWLATALIASGGATFMLVASLLVFVAIVLAIAAWARGSFIGVDPALILRALIAITRVSVVATSAAVIAGSVAVVGRSMVTAMGVAAAYVVLLEYLLRAARPLLARYFLVDAMSVVISWRPMELVQAGRTWMFTPSLGLITLGGYVVFTLAGAFVAVSRRDVLN